MKQDRPNIILIMSDNQSADFLGAYGNNEVHTPALNALAQNGLLFRNAYCVNAMCSPCRASVLTGLMPSTHGIHTWLDDGLEDEWPERWNAIGEFESLPERLQTNGYKTALIGKYHLGKAWQPPSSFDHWVTFPHGHTVSFFGNRMIDNDQNYVYEGHSVDFFTERTIAFLETQKTSSAPFFAFVPYNGPYGHWPAIRGRADNAFANLYDHASLDSVPREGLSQSVIDRYTKRVLEAGTHPHERFAGPLKLPNDTNSLKNYFAQTSLIDSGVGRIVAKLKSLEMDQNTLVIYTADHGFSLGNHGIWGHGLAAWPSSMHRPSYNIPLIISGCGVTRNESHALVSQLDLPNTILSFARLPLLRGNLTDSLPLDLNDPPTMHREAVFVEQEETRAIRTSTHLYVERFNVEGFDGLEPELYDLVNDPDERVNIVDTPDVADIQATLVLQLQSYFEKVSTPKRDLWRGGRPKSNISHKAFWQTAWGQDWNCGF